MAIFQKYVINSIKQDESLIASRWNNFQNYIAKIDAIHVFKIDKKTIQNKDI
ncbi:MAG: hypothetical protein Q7T77_02265 [Sulfuricurvum sp.]|nr:hypothetical protein [Sulfuricurvum sp.]